MINFIKTKRAMWIKGTKEDRFVASIYRSADTPLDTIAKEISHATSVSYPDVLAALKALEMHIALHVMNGSAVKFGTLGSFIPALRSKAVTKADDVTAQTVKRITCRFFPSVAFRSQMKSAELELKDLNKVKHI
ncbi:MAG: hypothetical protein ACTTJH_08275 [Bacteroidales bacterium]